MKTLVVLLAVLQWALLHRPQVYGDEGSPANSRPLTSPQIVAIPAGEDDPAVRSLFESQYPEAYKALTGAVARIRGRISI